MACNLSNMFMMDYKQYWVWIASTLCQPNAKRSLVNVYINNQCAPSMASKKCHSLLMNRHGQIDDMNPWDSPYIYNIRPLSNIDNLILYYIYNRSVTNGKVWIINNKDVAMFESWIIDYIQQNPPRRLIIWLGKRSGRSVPHTCERGWWHCRNGNKHCYHHRPFTTRSRTYIHIAHISSHPNILV